MQHKANIMARAATTLQTVLGLTLVAVLAAGCAASSADNFATELNGPQSNTGLTAEAGAVMGGSESAARGANGFATAAAANEVSKATAAAKPGSTAYRIGPEDVIELSVFKVPDLAKTVTVTELGTISLPLVGEVQAGGRTTREIEQELTQKLGAKYIRNPQVNLTVKEYNSQRVTVEGEVKKPGVYPIRGRLTLLQAVATAGGFEQVADTSEILVFRQNGGKQAAAKFDIDAIRNGRVKDVELVAGDTIIINTSMSKSAFQNVLKVLPLAGVFVGLL